MIAEAKPEIRITAKGNQGQGIGRKEKSTIRGVGNGEYTESRYVFAAIKISTVQSK